MYWKRRKPALALLSFVCVVSTVAMYHSYVTTLPDGDSKQRNHVRISNCSFGNANRKTHTYRLTSPIDYKNMILHGYGPWDLISKIVQMRGNFEPEIDKLIYYFLSRNPSALFVDIGANIGIRSLQVAKYDRKVVAVEALEENLFRFCRSIAANEVSEMITVVHNAVAESHKVVKLGKYKDSMGCSFVSDDDNVVKARKGQMTGTFDEQVPTILLDDLLDLDVVRSAKGVFIKIDIEGYEEHAIKGAHLFFRSNDVIGVVMEWRWHRGKQSSVTIMEFMRKFSFLPFKFNDAATKFDMLRWDDYHGTDFPHDILWLSTNYAYQVIQL